MQITSASGAGTSRASHCSRIFWTRLRVSSRKAKEQQRAKRVNIAADARLPKPKLLGRRIGTRAKFDGVGIGAIAPNARDPQVDNHQRREGHASIGRIPHARYDDVRGFKIAVDYRYPRLPRGCKTSMQLAHRFTQNGIQPAGIIGRRPQAPHQRPECLAFDILHHHVELVAHTAAIDDSGQVLKTTTGALGRKQALIHPANLGRCVDTFANKGAERPATRALKIDEFGRLDIRKLEHALHTIAVIAVERRQMLDK